MAALRSDPKCSRTNVYAPLLNRIAPCHQTKSKCLKPILVHFMIFEKQRKLVSISAEGRPVVNSEKIVLSAEA
jgi:hypothetical protein